MRILNYLLLVYLIGFFNIALAAEGDISFNGFNINSFLIEGYDRSLVVSYQNLGQEDFYGNINLYCGKSEKSIAESSIILEKNGGQNSSTLNFSLSSPSLNSCSLNLSDRANNIVHRDTININIYSKDDIKNIISKLNQDELDSFFSRTNIKDTSLFVDTKVSTTSDNQDTDNSTSTDIISNIKNKIKSFSDDLFSSNSSSSNLKDKLDNIINSFNSSTTNTKEEATQVKKEKFKIYSIDNFSDSILKDKPDLSFRNNKNIFYSIGEYIDTKISSLGDSHFIIFKILSYLNDFFFGTLSSVYNMIASAFTRLSLFLFPISISIWIGKYFLYIIAFIYIILKIKKRNKRILRNKNFDDKFKRHLEEEGEDAEDEAEDEEEESMESESKPKIKDEEKIKKREINNSL